MTFDGVDFLGKIVGSSPAFILGGPCLGKLFSHKSMVPNHVEKLRFCSVKKKRELRFFEDSRSKAGY